MNKDTSLLKMLLDLTTYTSVIGGKMMMVVLNAYNQYCEVLNGLEIVNIPLKSKRT
jgi:hypothetical protein